MQRMHCKISRSTNPRSAASSARGGCSSGWSSPTPKGRGSLPDTDHPRERGFVNVQALKRGDPSSYCCGTPEHASHKQKTRRAALADKTLERYPILAHGGVGAGPRGPKSLPFTYKMYCSSFVSYAVTT